VKEKRKRLFHLKQNPWNIDFVLVITVASTKLSGEPMTIATVMVKRQLETHAKSLE
jgi:hypothetical protein